MTLSLANSSGLWALLGVPAILLIHFLQTKSRTIRVSTLFLLKPLAKESTGGRRIERLRNSVPLWLQLLAVVLLAWLLAEPRWIKSDSTQGVVVVLDSSLSMRAFQQQLAAVLPARLRTLARSAAKTEWILIESDPAQPTLYTGGDVEALAAVLKKWKPRLGAHDFMPALRLGQSLLRQHGLLIFVTDRRVEKLPAGVELIAIGTPTDNCGFAGLRIETGKAVWHALVKNYGATLQRRSWWIEIGGQKSAPEQIALEPGQALALKGSFPGGTQTCTLVLSGDAFSIDDRLPIALPQPKRLKVSAETGTSFSEFFDQLLASAQAIDRIAENDAPDLKLAVYSPLSPVLPAGNALVFLKEPGPRDKFLAGPVIAENDPLTDGLNWQGLLCKDTLRIPQKPEDRVLLWQDDRPLISVRGGAHRQLLFSFDLDQSNAKRLPAFVILLHRFIESVRSEKIAPETVNVETNQTLRVNADPAGKPVELRADDASGNVTAAPAQAQTLRAPVEPGFFEVKQGSAILLKGAAHFADARTADLRGAESFDSLQNRTIASLAEKNSRQDFLAPVWTLLVAGLLTLNWAWRGRK